MLQFKEEDENGPSGVCSTYRRSEPRLWQILSQSVRSQFSLDVAEQSREVLLLSDPVPLDRLFIGRKLDRMVHGVSVGALKFDRGPPRLRLFERMKQLDCGLRIDVSL